MRGGAPRSVRTLQVHLDTLASPWCTECKGAQKVELRYDMLEVMMSNEKSRIQCFITTSQHAVTLLTLDRTYHVKVFLHGWIPFLFVAWGLGALNKASNSE